MAVMLLGLAAPALSTANDKLTPLADGEAIWLLGDDAGNLVDGSTGQVTVNDNGATITVRTNGLTPGQAYTAWAVYFNGSCTHPETAEDSFPDTNCGFGDLLDGNGGIVRLAGNVVGASGMATFSGHINVGDGSEIGPPGVVAYDPVSPDFHIIVRSHGPMVPSEMPAQIDSVGGGCVVDDVFPVEVGECGDVQLFIFETTPA
jgi:hypothetical protein